MNPIREKGRPKRELFTRNGIYYARYSATERFSTDTNDPAEAARRLEKMRAFHCPWKKIPKSAEAFDPEKLRKAYGYKADGERDENAIDICKLLDEELALKRNADKPDNTIRYFDTRFRFLKKYVTDNRLTLATFDQRAALSFIRWRMTYVPGKAGDLGYNGKHATAGTINKEIATFRNLWRLWQGEGREGCTINPWVRITRLPKSWTAEEIAEKPYTLEDIKRIFDQIENETVRDVLIFQVMLGTRPGMETLNITQEMINGGKIYNFKKRRLDDFDYSDEAKAWYKEKIKGKIAGLDADIICEHFKKACMKINEEVEKPDDKIRVGKPYDLRHSFGTESLKSFKIETVSKMLRHSEIRTTQTYAKVRSDEAKEARETMQGEILSKVKEEKPPYK